MEKHVIDKIYIDGEFVTPHGTELFDLFNPATGEVIGQVQLADEADTQAAVAAAKRALPAWSATSREERIAALRRLQEAVAARRDEMRDAVLVEYGAPVRNQWMVDSASSAFGDMIATLESFEFTRHVGTATVEMAPIGVAGLISPWNSDMFFMADKIATALAAGCTIVMKPSEMSATQTQVVTRAFHEAGLPAGVINIVTGRATELLKVLAEHDDLDGIWSYGDAEMCASAKALSVGNLKQVWTNEGRHIDFFDNPQSEGRWYLEHAHQVKNIWVPYGE